MARAIERRGLALELHRRDDPAPCRHPDNSAEQEWDTSSAASVSS
jgi:hypothetical protein